MKSRLVNILSAMLAVACSVSIFMSTGLSRTVLITDTGGADGGGTVAPLFNVVSRLDPIPDGWYANGENYDMNNAGQVMGAIYGESSGQVVTWDSVGHMQVVYDLDPNINPGAVYFYNTAYSASGRIVGFEFLDAASSASYLDPVAGYVPIVPPDSNYSDSWRVSDNDLMVGNYGKMDRETGEGTHGIFLYDIQQSTFVQFPGDMVRDVNIKGQVLVENDTTVNDQSISSLCIVNPFMAPKSCKPLPLFGGTSTQGGDINDLGQVVYNVAQPITNSCAYPPCDPGVKVYILLPNGTSYAPSAAGYAFSRGGSLNRRGEMVGFSYNDSNEPQQDAVHWLYTNRSVFKLSDLRTTSGEPILKILDLNDVGDIFAKLPSGLAVLKRVS